MELKFHFVHEWFPIKWKGLPVSLNQRQRNFLRHFIFIWGNLSVQFWWLHPGSDEGKKTYFAILLRYSLCFLGCCAPGSNSRQPTTSKMVSSANIISNNAFWNNQSTIRRARRRCSRKQRWKHLFPCSFNDLFSFVLSFKKITFTNNK